VPGIDPAFTRNLREIIGEPLIREGFTFDGRRVFRRRVDGGRVHIADVQVGDRFMAGKFTINLALFDPAQDGQKDPATVREHDCAWPRRQRLGLLMPSRFRRLERLPGVGVLFGPKDRWWSARAVDGLQEARLAMVAYGLPWYTRS
jgi:hypothetical protein